MLLEIVLLLSVAILWGATNPFIKRGSTGIKHIQADSFLKRLLLEIQYIFTNWKYIVPMVINQTGSLLYFVTLQYAHLSVAVPVTNSLTFVFTALTGWILGEKLPNRNTLIGMLLILAGAVCCFGNHV